MVSNLIELDSVGVDIGQKVILDKIDLGIPQGSIFGVIGPSGVGKSTLLGLMSRMRCPSRGLVKVFGEDISRLSDSKITKMRCNMGMVFQAGALFTHLSVYENVAFGLRIHYKLPEDIIRDIVKLKLEAVGLRGTEDLYPASLSGGMARRVALARSLSLDPQIMLYDEPITGLDPIAVAVILKLMRELNVALEMTSVIVSHQIEELASICTHMCVLVDGGMVANGTVAEIMMSDNPILKQFIQGNADGPVPFRYCSRPLAEDLNVAY